MPLLTEAQVFDRIKNILETKTSLEKNRDQCHYVDYLSVDDPTKAGDPEYTFNFVFSKYDERMAFFTDIVRTNFDDPAAGIFFDDYNVPDRFSFYFQDDCKNGMISEWIGQYILVDCTVIPESVTLSKDDISEMISQYRSTGESPPPKTSRSADIYR